jgi:FSR family fosmidomycin resistance protein-like MFS transporter
MADFKPAALSAAGPVLAPAVSGRVRPNVKLIGLLAAGHCVIDVNQGSLTALLPFLKSSHALTYAQAAMILLIANLTSSIIQPLFGYLSDQIARRWLLPASVALSGIGLGLTGLAPTYAVVLALIVVTGIGVAAWHPEGYKTATGVAGARKATALSWFSFGGNVGIAVGPAVITALVTTLGLAGTLGMIIPSAIMAALILAALPLIGRAAAPVRTNAAQARGADMPGALALLIGVVTLRSWTTLGFSTFVPFFYIDVLKQDPAMVGPLLFVYLGGGALGSIVAGPLADRWGARPFIRWVFLAALPFGIGFMLADGVLRFVMLALFGALMTSSFSVSVVLAQAYLPRRAGMASGLIVGFAIGTGGVAVTLLGVLADHYGVTAALWSAVLLPVAGFAAARFLPAPRTASVQ